MMELAVSYEPGELVDVAYALYELRIDYRLGSITLPTFQPKVSPGEGRWGQKGDLDLGLIRSLCRKGGVKTG